MIKRIVSFLDKHRLFLVLLILLIIVALFLGINSYLFFHHEFTALSCTKEIDKEYCYSGEVKIYKDTNKSKEEFFNRYTDEIDVLVKTYNLDEFNYYTAYYYLVASRLHYEMNEEYKILEEFFQVYADTYNLEEFYFNNTLYFNIFYPYKIN